VAYLSVLDNNFTDAETAKIENNYYVNVNNTNDTDTIATEYCKVIDKDSRQGLNILPGGQLMNLDPFLSDSNAIELINDIEQLNIEVPTKENSEKDQVIAEGYIPIATTNKETKMDDSVFFGTWGADSLLNDAMPMLDDSMKMVNPLRVEGKNCDFEEMESESTTASSTAETQSANTPKPDDVESHSDMPDLMEILKSDDEEWLTSILDKMESDEEKATNEPVSPAGEPDLLKIILDKTIGIEYTEEVCNAEYSTLSPQDIAVPIEVESRPHTQEVRENFNETAAVPVKTRKGPGRPRKIRTTNKVTKPRGRPTKSLINLESVANEHHNYSNGGASTSTATLAEKRYRRMRDLNNIASQRCRLKRKSKMHSALDDLKQEEEKNKELTMRVRILEEQVQTLKKHFINRISNPAVAATPAVAQVMEWNGDQLERFVDDVANRHLSL
jgi:hypothetical protein